MSLNWKEIGLVLDELDLEGAKIERVIQPSYDTISLGLYKPGRPVELLISVAQGACRIHAISSPPPKPRQPLRFMECLRSRIRGGRIDSVRQIGRERVVRFDISVPRDEEGDQGLEGSHGLRRYRLYVRLWSGAGNIVLVDEEALVVDAIARRPRRGEVSGERCGIEEELAEAAAKAEGAARAGDGKPPREFSVRELPGEGSFSQRLETHYSASVGELSRERLIETARERFRRRSLVLGTRIAELDRKAGEFRESGRWKELGDILMASQGREYEGSFLRTEDFFRGGEVSIPVDPRIGIVANAQAYYERQRKARSGLADLEAELEASRTSLRRLEAELAEIEALQDPFLIARELQKGGTTKSSERRSFPGLSLEREGWTILVGRSAKENDELLRRHVRGSDSWFHARDWAGSYVFVKARPGKSLPLDILLDAGNLAIYYSKGRSNGGGEVYYTFVKYLRRAKGGPKGLVIPMQEKNLSIRLEEERLKELRALIGIDEG